MKLIEIPRKQQEIINIFLQKGDMQSSDVHAKMREHGNEASLVTVKRALSAMAKAGILSVAGSGRSTIYSMTALGRIYSDIDVQQYGAAEPDVRYGLNHFNFELLPALPTQLFTEKELGRLSSATKEYQKRTKGLPETIRQKELQRLVIELSWKSSKMEGNTYTLLDTEKLILENKKAPGHSKQETQMILNHKDAFLYIYRHPQQFKTLTRKNMDEVHSLLVIGLGVGAGLRKKPVGVTGSKYLPLDNVHQINDAIEALQKAVRRMSTPYAKALVALAGISYIQPFEDGNKRTSRLMANALLVSHGLAPLSYRSVDENKYRVAMLVWYEINSIIPLKNIFIEQYEFAARNYAVK